MNVTVGIDLGSTTTKAIVLDEQGRIVGRGITNSRSNYDVAAQVAREEAFTNVRFSMLSRALEESKLLKGRQAEFENALSRGFALEGYLGQLDRLEVHCREDLSSGRYGDLTLALSSALSDILRRLRKDATALFAPGRNARSDFFRDIAGSGFISAASEISRAGGPPFDRIVGLFDKSIIPVENEPESRSFSQRLLAGFGRIAGSFGVDASRVRELLARVADTPLTPVRLVGTGYGRARLPFPKDQIRSEILCHGLGAHLMFPNTRTVLDIGGQDTKAIQVDPIGVVTSFQMNDRCAAGCGRYLGYIADEMNLGLHELGPLAMESKHRVKINSTCTVFAGAEFRDRLSAGEAREDILAGLHRAIILRAMALLARSGGVKNEFTFTGGVAKNQAAVNALRELVAENYGQVTLNIAPDSIFTGALGAATFAHRDIQAGAAASGEQQLVKASTAPNSGECHGDHCGC
ncbi:benzoyl-CoA reductase subunit A [bacterium]|nr:MAG: benzoyl-CoA reductase subunit A [bacterium]RIK61718.1 MAG: benzoyl-CoA reductase subunit A [Planctomycetota bacterium]